MPTPAEIQDMLNASEGPNRDLDVLIWAATRPEPGWTTRTWRGVVIPENPRYPRSFCQDDVPELTASADAAFELTEKLLPGWRLRLTNELEGADGTEWQALIRVPSGGAIYRNAASRPVAILRALMDAWIPRRAEG